MRVNAETALPAAEMKASELEQHRGEIHGRKGGLAAALQSVKAIQAEIQNYRSFAAFPAASALIFQPSLKLYINPLFCGLMAKY